MKQLVVFGAGGVGKEVIMTINAINSKIKQWELKGFYDDNPNVRLPKGYYRLGGLQELLSTKEKLNIILAIKDSARKGELASQLRARRFRFVNIIHPTALICESAQIGLSAYVGAYSVIGPNTEIGNHLYMGNHTSVGHDTTIGDCCSIMPGSIISGNVIVERNTFIGAGATILQSLTVNEFCVVGAGAVVTKDVQKGTKVVGIPARPIDD